MRRVPRTFRKSGGSSNLEKEGGSGSPSLWRLLWQPGWHPRGGSALPPHPPPPHNKGSSPKAMGESSDGDGEDGGTPQEVEIEKVESWLDEHPHFVYDYFVRKASRQMVDSWLLSHSAPQGMVQENSSSNVSPTSPNSGTSSPVRKISAHEFERGGLLRPIVSTTVDGVPTFLSLPLPGDSAQSNNTRVGRKSRQELRALDERELIFELVKDICNDLEIRSLCHKILQNVFSRYLQFCGIGLRNAQLYERSELENKRNQVLLDLARMVFEEQSTIEHIVYRIMTHTQSLLQCERCQILLVDESTKTFSRVFDLDVNDTKVEDENRKSPFEGRFPINIGITGYVATTGETLNISDVHADNRFDPLVDRDSSFSHHSVLCMPIRNAEFKILGVSQLINKLSGVPFNKNDEHLFEAFAIFCGMGIQNTQMYEKAIKAIAKTKVTLDVLSYHATAPIEEAKQLSKYIVPSTHVYKLQDLKFNDFSLNDEDMLKACLRMFMDLDLIERFHIDYVMLCRWLLSVRKNYRQVTYHNWRHAFNVGQMMFAVLTITKFCHVLGEVETLALIIACLSHDLDHRGTNNSFQIKSCSPLAQLYSTSTMEHHHFDQCIMILNSEGNQILSHLSPDEYSHIVHVLEDAILATDLAVYFRRRGTFFHIVETKTHNWKREDHRELLRAMLMTICDIAAITKPWETQKVVAELVASEFFQQGDIEKEKLKIQPIV
ncbi:dual 3',5'-cyclic-AMP and -GMP phosphodiesterase 11-like [Uloborus diversus]|uniref:dual 3',5'-cyclic-AMP and -GMP phosphodiesterase 11-like n=1 Tax=Uloborus diversus TaxID=327109 RepID=UPI002409751F|nr:dual 3',5'-cyclic-AMP and -GMP phosphodiesterase 11-like [Uloborus diversus]